MASRAISSYLPAAYGNCYDRAIDSATVGTRGSRAIFSHERRSARDGIHAGVAFTSRKRRVGDHIEAHFREHGFGLCAVELRQNHSFVGFIGLAVPKFQASFNPCVEIGWRLSPEYWGQGLATEGAREVVRYAFGDLGLKDLVSFTIPGNGRSRLVMEKLGMTHNPADDFDHPNLPQEHPLRRHVLYRLRCTEFESALFR